MDVNEGTADYLIKEVIDDSLFYVLDKFLGQIYTYWTLKWKKMLHSYVWSPTCLYA